MNPGPKFRVWDTKNNEWLGESDPNTLTYYGFHLFGEVMTMQHMPGEMLGHIVIEQFTGLRDKNGNEIYEGDIVRHMGGGGYMRVSQVKFDRGCCNVGTHSGSSTVGKPMLLNSRMTILGNIHQNPELLEDK